MRRICASRRNSRLRKDSIAAGLAAGLALAPVPASAQLPVIDVAAIAKLVAQYEVALQQLEQQIQILLNAIQNTINLGEAPWILAEQDVLAVRNLTNQASLLTGNISTTIGNLNNPAGYFPQLAAFQANWPQQLATWNNTIGNAYQNLGQVLQLQNTQAASDLSVLTALQGMTPQGREQALEIAHRLAMAEAKELHEMNVTMTAAAQTQQTTNAVRAEKEAVQDAAWQQMLQFTPLPATGQSFTVGGQ